MSYEKKQIFCDIRDTISDLPSLLAFGLSTFSRTRIASVLQSVEAAKSPIGTSCLYDESCWTTMIHPS